MFNVGADLAKELLKPENIATLKAAGLEMLQSFVRSNVVHLDANSDEQGFHFAISFTQKGNPQ